MTTNHNHIGYQARLDFVQGLLRKEFGIEVSQRKGLSILTTPSANYMGYAPQTDVEITPIQYEPDFIFRYNNFVYRVTLRTPITSSNIKKAPRPGCVAVPDGIKELIVRLANPDA